MIANDACARQFWAMTGIAAQPDAKLKTLDPKAASSLEKLVRDALELVDAQTGAGNSELLRADFLARISHAFGDEPLERPPQGELEKREDW